MKITEVTKRDGRVVKFDINKISEAIFKANLNSTDSTMDKDKLLVLSNKVVKQIGSNEKSTVENIQDIVEKVLIDSKYISTAKSFILYRDEHSKIRKHAGDLMKIYGDLTFKTVEDADIKRENANIDTHTAMGTMLKYGSEGSKYFIDTNILPKEIMQAHKNGDIHIHDKDFYMLTETCCQIDLIKLFKNGFSTGHGYLREPNGIASYSALACIAIQANQNEMHGGQAVPNFDYSMAPGVAKTFKKEYFTALVSYFEIVSQALDLGDDVELLVKALTSTIATPITMGTTDHYCEVLLSALDKFHHSNRFEMVSSAHIEKGHEYAVKTALSETDKATYQAMESFVHNLNTMNSRAGAQVPFSSINYGTDTSPEARMVMKNLLLSTEAGLGNGETPIFPIQIFKVKEGINYNSGDPNYDLFKLAMKVSAKRLFPNFSFMDAPFNIKYYKKGDYNSEVAYMGCRTRVMGNVFDPENEVTCGRGNLSFTTINLPRLGIEAEGNILKFYEKLDHAIELVCTQLLHRFKIQCTKKGHNYPFLMGQGVWIGSEKIGPDDSIADILKHGTLSVGFIGLAETLVALTGKHHGESNESQKLGLEIIGYMRDRMDKKSQEMKLNFTLVGTPAEGLSGRFVAIDKFQYGSIPRVTDREYYTNSFHVPVYYNTSAYHKIQVEAPYHEFTNAGHISYVELDGDTCKNIDAFESIIRCMKESGIGYGSVNHPVDRDPVCGFNGIIDNECPGCHRHEELGDPKFERIRRITGYLVGTTDRWNDAKRAEERDRVKHS